MLGPASIPSRSVTPPLSESARSRRETKLLSSTATCAPPSPRLPAEALRTLERIYKDSTADSAPGPRRWGSWHGATLASELTLSDEEMTSQQEPVARSPVHHSMSISDQRSAATIGSRSGHLQTSTADTSLSQRLAMPDDSGAAPEQHNTSGYRTSTRRTQRSSAWGKTRASVPSQTGHRVDVSKAMHEDEAWGTVDKWRRVVDANFDPSLPAPVARYARLAEDLDVAAMEPAEQQRTAEASGMPLEDILEIQQQRADALSTLTQLHSRLVHKVSNHLKRTTMAAVDLEDIRVEGMALLRLCIWTYRESHGTTFATHAWIQLEGRMKAAMLGKDRVVQMPLAELTRRKRVWAAHASLSSGPRASRAMRSDDDTPTPAMVAAVAKRTRSSEEDVRRILSHEYVVAEVSPDAFNTDTSGDGWDQICSDADLDGAIYSGDEDEGQAGEDDPELLSLLDVPELRGAVEDVLNRIPAVHADVLACRYGLRGQEPLGYKATAARLGFQHRSLVNYHQARAVKSFLNMMAYMHKGVLAGAGQQ